MLMRTYFLAWTALCIVLFCGCHQDKSDQGQAGPNEPGAKVCETLLPRTFRFSMWGSAVPGSDVLVWDGETLMYKTSGFSHPKTTKIVPSVEQWRAFWEKLEEIEVWEWQGRYDLDAITYDGGGWGLVIEYGEKTIRSSGRSAWPSDFTKFREVVGTLIGKASFP